LSKRNKYGLGINVVWRWEGVTFSYSPFCNPTPNPSPNPNPKLIRQILALTLTLSVADFLVQKVPHYSSVLITILNISAPSYPSSPAMKTALLSSNPPFLFLHFFNLWIYFCPIIHSQKMLFFLAIFGVSFSKL
jgi:hypothetical protein